MSIYSYLAQLRYIKVSHGHFMSGEEGDGPPGDDRAH